MDRWAGGLNTGSREDIHSGSFGQGGAPVTRVEYSVSSWGSHSKKQCHQCMRCNLSPPLALHLCPDLLLICSFIHWQRNVNERLWEPELKIWDFTGYRGNHIWQKLMWNNMKRPQSRDREIFVKKKNEQDINEQTIMQEENARWSTAQKHVFQSLRLLHHSTSALPECNYLWFLTKYILYSKISIHVD